MVDMEKEKRNASALTHPIEGVGFSHLCPFSARGLQLKLNLVALVFMGSGMLQCKDQKSHGRRGLGGEAEILRRFKIVPTIILELQKQRE